MIGAKVTLRVAAAIGLLAGCTRSPADATPEGAVRSFVERMESGAEDARAMRDAYQLLGPRAKANLRERANRASRSQGRRYEPHEMLAEGRFGLRFRVASARGRIEGGEAIVEVSGEGPDERASVHCTKEPAGWRVEPDLPEPARRSGS